MKYMDEEIIQAINHEEERHKELKEHESVDKGIKVLGKMIELEQKGFIDGKVMMHIPKDFTLMPKEMAKLKYPYEHRPDIIFMDSTSIINITFNYMADKITNDEIEEFRDYMVGMLKRMQPSARWFEIDAEQIDDKKVAFCEFTSPALDEKIYNFMFFLEVEGQILMTTFNCMARQMKYWKPVAYEIMKSIKIQIKDNGEE